MRPVSVEDASNICMHRCRAMCCQGPLILRLSRAEVGDFKERAASLNLGSVRVQPSKDGSGLVRFGDHPGERCPMLDSETWACRIYRHRPSRCRDFPERLTPGCPLSEAVFAERTSDADQAAVSQGSLAENTPTLTLPHHGREDKSRLL